MQMAHTPAGGWDKTGPGTLVVVQPGSSAFKHNAEYNLHEGTLSTTSPQIEGWVNHYAGTHAVTGQLTVGSDVPGAPAGVYQMTDWPGQLPPPPDRLLTTSLTKVQGGSRFTQNYGTHRTGAVHVLGTGSIYELNAGLLDAPELRREGRFVWRGGTFTGSVVDLAAGGVEFDKLGGSPSGGPVFPAHGFTYGGTATITDHTVISAVAGGATYRNSGTLRKASGSGTAVIGADVTFATTAGVLDVQAG